MTESDTLEHFGIEDEEVEIYEDGEEPAELDEQEQALRQIEENLKNNIY